MEIKIIEDSKNKLVFNIEGAGHSLCNLLVKEIWNDESVKNAAYTIEHPLKGIPTIMVETMQGKDEPRKVVDNAIKRLRKTNEKFKDSFLKAIKGN